MNPFLRYLADKNSAHTQTDRQTDRHTPLTTRPDGLRRAGNKLVRTYVRTYVRTSYVHTYVRTFVRTYVRTYEFIVIVYVNIHSVCTKLYCCLVSAVNMVRTYVRTYVRRTYIHTYIFTDSFVTHFYFSILAPARFKLMLPMWHSMTSNMMSNNI